MKTCNINKKFMAYFLVWLFFVLVNFDLSLGSYGESEPKAGSIFLVFTIIIIGIGIGLYMKYQPKMFHIKS